MLQPVGDARLAGPGAHLPDRVPWEARLGFQVAGCQGNFEPRKSP